jgi:hypothetical protein
MMVPQCLHETGFLLRCDPSEDRRLLGNLRELCIVHFSYIHSRHHLSAVCDPYLLCQRSNRLGMITRNHLIIDR